MPSEGSRVTDETGVKFILGQEIASGAQGAVFRVVDHPDYAIKILKQPKDLDRIAAVRRLPLDGLPVAAPLTLINADGGSGYLMRLARDMKQLRDLYLPQEFGQRRAGKTWYHQTGGLRRRLAIASVMAHALASLHERGLAYVDLNPGNVMISDDLSRAETWLIDTDNLTSRSNPDWNIWGFPRYVAPERALRRTPPSTLADAYILAIHVFRLLVLKHPLEGIATDEIDRETAWDQIDHGEFPYVMDPGDQSNRLRDRSFSAALFPLVMTKRMRDLAERTFTDGRLDPVRRPGAARWREVLFSALDNVVDCPSCGWSYYRLAKNCPACQAVTGEVPLVTVYPVGGEQPLPARDSLVISLRAETPIFPRHVWGRYDQPDPVVTFRPTEDGFDIDAHDEARVTSSSGKDRTRIWRPAPGEAIRLRLSVPGRPARDLRVRSVAQG